MKVEFLKKFSKDIDDVRTRPARQAVIRVIELMEELILSTRFLIQKN